MEKVIISVEKELSPIRLKNMLFTVVVLNFIWMLFHFTVVFFFTLNLKSVALVWVFLWIWNFFAFLLDIPIWIIQNYFKSKTLYITASISQIVAMLIFADFILKYSTFVLDPINENVWFLGSFLSSWFNILLLVIASFCYWLTKELQDVTSISYILNNSSPNQYASIFSKNNLAMWIWSLFWLLLSWVILTLNPKLIIFTIVLLIFAIIYFTSRFFDNSDETIELKDISKFKVIFDKNNYKNLWEKVWGIWENIKDKIVKTVSKIELKDIIDKSKYLFIKPASKKSGLSIWILINETKKAFILTYNVLTKSNWILIVYWSIIMLLTFWFRDTFASTFLIKYLDGLKEWWSYILLWFIAVPAFWLQWFFWKMADKFWSYKVSLVWLILSWISLVLMWIFSKSWNIVLVMSLALINSSWYASCMSLSQAKFLETYNKTYANYNNLKEIDANASAAPMKILQNLANVFWLLFWWLFLAMLNYMWFFIVFWLFILWLLIWSLKRKKDIKAWETQPQEQQESKPVEL